MNFTINISKKRPIAQKQPVFFQKLQDAGIVTFVSCFITYYITTIKYKVNMFFYFLQQINSFFEPKSNSS